MTFSLWNSSAPPASSPGTQPRILSSQFSVLNGALPAMSSAPSVRAAALSTLAREADEDQDGLPDWLEVRFGSNPRLADSDGDGLPDGAEFKFRGHHLQAHPDDDDDLDGLSNLAEVRGGTDPANPDSDGDGLLDGDEIRRYGTHPMVQDSDGDGVSDGDEVKEGSSPLDANNRLPGHNPAGAERVLVLGFTIGLRPKGTGDRHEKTF